MNNASLAGIIRRLSRPLAPQPTNVEPRLPKLPGIRAVVFDVYGTLLISGSGDISLTSGVSQNAAATEALRQIQPQPPAAADTTDLADKLREQIQTEHAQADTESPEVDIRASWKPLVPGLTNAQIEQLATEYECRVNPIWPMPGCRETLASLQKANLPIGIISNAQFFTPIAMEALLDESMPSLGFDQKRCIWSYEHLRAKPGRFLYERMTEALAADGITPREALYVGNDMRNDVAPAAAVGFRTALFAGDARSLRLRDGDPLVEGVTPDAVVTELPQILDCLG